MLLVQALVAAEPKVEFQPKRTWAFKEAGVKFNNEFSGARLNDCQQTVPTEFKLVISPENKPINPSPWYAFKVTAAVSTTITVQITVTYTGSVLRPRLSRDGTHWTMLDPASFSSKPKTREAKAKLQVGPAPLWVAAQEMIGLKQLGAWTDEKARLPFARESVIGKSIEHRPIRQIVFHDKAAPNYVFIIGRQHPPEVTGSIALMTFVDTLTGKTGLARRYRQQFRTVVIPLVNPDGVEHGHWRLNLGGTDLNRDWRAFAQPETRAIRDTFLKLVNQPGARPFVLLDFHSTSSDIFYAQPDTSPTFPVKFTDRWLAAFQARFSDYTFKRDDAHNARAATSKAWGYETFHIPAITYELGYNTDRSLIRKTVSSAAEEMMRLLLTEVGHDNPIPMRSNKNP